MKPFSTVSPHCCPDRQTDIQAGRQTDRQPHSSQDSMVLLLWDPPGFTHTFLSGSCAQPNSLSSIIAIWPLKAQASLCRPQGALWRVFSQTCAFCICIWPSSEVLSLQSVGLEMRLQALSALKLLSVGRRAPFWGSHRAQVSVLFCPKMHSTLLLMWACQPDTQVHMHNKELSSLGDTLPTLNRSGMSPRSLKLLLLAALGLQFQAPPWD